ncbi:MAG: hypothetical protein JXL80_12085 [Planctomycetes bacterium]|nr:hypothetical protein [Planctomycetota bacterium]
MVMPCLSYDESRRQMAAETSAFIAWGLAHPDQVRWIPKRPIETGNFSRQATFVFWMPVLGLSMQRPLTWLRRVLGR